MVVRKLLAVTGLGLALVCAGCPSSKPAGPGPAAPAAVAPVVGTWKLDAPRSRQVYAEWVKTSPKHTTEQAQQSAIQEHGVMLSALEAKAAGAKLIIKPDNTWTAIEPGQSDSGGSWTFDAATGQLVTNRSDGGTGIRPLYRNGELHYVDHGATMLVFTKE